MMPLLLVAAIAVAFVAMSARRWRRARLRRAAADRPGSSPERAISIRSYHDMDAHLGRRWCACGGYLERRGEGTRQLGARRYRIARLGCQECESVEEVFFDTTDLLH
jgi:hypothetical protein